MNMHDDRCANLATVGERGDTAWAVQRAAYKYRNQAVVHGDRIESL